MAVLVAGRLLFRPCLMQFLFVPHTLVLLFRFQTNHYIYLFSWYLYMYFPAFLLVLVYVLSGFSSAFIISVMFAVALPLSSNDDVTQ